MSLSQIWDKNYDNSQAVVASGHLFDNWDIFVGHRDRGHMHKRDIFMHKGTYAQTEHKHKREICTIGTYMHNCNFFLGKYGTQ